MTMRMLQFPGTIVALWHLFRFIGSNKARFLGALNKFMSSAKTEDPWISQLVIACSCYVNCSKMAGCLFITDMRV